MGIGWYDDFCKPSTSKDIFTLRRHEIQVEKLVYISATIMNKKGLRQCAKLNDFGEVVVVVPGQ